MKNKKIRLALLDNNMKCWQLAKALEISEATLYRWMREELPEEKQVQIISIIEKGGDNGK